MNTFRLASLLSVVVAVEPVLVSNLCAQSDLRREGPYWVKTDKMDLPTHPKTRLKVFTRGSVTVLGQSRIAPAVTFTRRVRAGSENEARHLLGLVSLSVNERGNQTLLRLRGAEVQVVSVDLRILTPASSSEVSLETAGGSIQVRNIAGSVEAASGGGTISLNGIGGDAAAKTSGGDIQTGIVKGSLRIASGGGRIESQTAGGEAWLETAGGDISIDQVDGPLTVSTLGGNIHVGRAGSWVSAHTAGGRIDIVEAKGVVHADNAAGSVQIGSAAGVSCESSGGSIRLKGSAGALRVASDVGSILADLLSGFPMKDSIFTTGVGDITVYIPSDIALTIMARSNGEMAGKIISEFDQIRVLHSTRAEGELNGGGPVLRLTSSSGTIYLRKQR